MAQPPCTGHGRGGRHGSADVRRLMPMIKINLMVEARAERAARAPLISFGAAKVNNYILLGLIVLGLAFVGLRYWKLSSTLASIQAEIVVHQREYDRLKPIIAEVEAFTKKNAEVKP